MSKNISHFKIKKPLTIAKTHYKQKGQRGSIAVASATEVAVALTMTGRGITCPYAGLRNSIDNLNSSSAPVGAARLDCKVASLYKEHTMTTQLGSPGKPADLNPCLHPRSYMKLTSGFLNVAKHHSMTTQSDKKMCCMCSRQKRDNTIRQENVLHVQWTEGDKTRQV